MAIIVILLLSGNAYTKWWFLIWFKHNYRTDEAKMGENTVWLEQFSGP